MTFAERLDRAIARADSLLCVGLDPDPRRMAVPDVAAFNRAIVEATSDLVCAYKPQLAFYEALGSAGLVALEETVRFIREQAPEVLILGDGKRGDIGSTAAAYARAMFERWDFDAATVNVYQGYDAVEPFLGYEGRGALVVCRTTNESSADFQELTLERQGRGARLFEYVAEAAERWSDGAGNLGLVVGATAPRQLEEMRRRHPQLPFLIPGVGAQGGDVARAVGAGVDAGGRGAVLNSARGILYASGDAADFAAAARRAALELRDEIRSALR